MPTDISECCDQSPWTEVIVSGRPWLDLRVAEIWRYRDLLLMLVRRDFVAVYKQTLLGPLWFFVRPLITTLTFTVIFGRLARISTQGTPHLLFYMAGIICWNYFADCLHNTATTFHDNQRLFGKVYFPRLVVPLSVVISGLLKFGLQLAMFLGFYAFYAWRGAPVRATAHLLLLPLLVLLMAGLGLGLGMIVTALTTKYRDLLFLLRFGVQLMMYATPVIYPLASVPGRYLRLAMANPMSAVIEFFRYGFLGKGMASPAHLLAASAVVAAILVAGILVFNRTEQNFIDTV